MLENKVKFGLCAVRLIRALNCPRLIISKRCMITPKFPSFRFHQPFFQKPDKNTSEIRGDILNGDKGWWDIGYILQTNG